MRNTAPAYGLWALVIINSAAFILFALSFTQPRTRRDRRAFGGFAAFVVAPFTEMYGFPLTIYLLSGWLSRRLPDLDLLSHNTGHLPETLLGWKGDLIYARLAWREEREVRAVFGVAYDRYAAVTPAFVPRPGGRKRAGRSLPSPGASL